MKKTIVYYTDSRLEWDLDRLVRKRLEKAAGDIPIISVSQKPIALGKNICVGYKPRSYLSLYEQVLVGLNQVPDDHIVYLVEHDVFYHPSHFEFEPIDDKHIFFNLNRYYWRRNAKFFLKSIGKRALSQCVSNKPVLLEHIKEQVQLREMNVPCPNVGPFSNFTSEFPNVDIRHSGNFSDFGIFDKTRRSPRVLEIPYWGTPRMFKSKSGLKDFSTYIRLMLHDTLNKDNLKNPVLVNMLRRQLPELFNGLGYKVGAEVGVKWGTFSLELLKGIKGLELYCIDNYAPHPDCGWDRQEDNFQKARSVLEPHNVKFLKKDSLQAARFDIPDWSLDFVFIDSDHSFDAFMQDLIVWTKKVKPGGIVSGHDFDSEIDPWIKKALMVYTKVHDIELFVTQIMGGYPDNVRSWFFIKR